jgi:sigma-B regulation protein RsbU (phosphoserine phosphatase)
LPGEFEPENKGCALKILAVEDDPVARKVLVQALKRLGYEDVVEARDGGEALGQLEKEPARVIVSDWVMPGMDGLALCRQVRARVKSEYVYFILLTSREADIENQREAIEAGVDDFLVKPLDLQELWMRLRVAERILRYATQVQQLEAFLPICSYCKKVRDDQNYWQQIEGYINARTGSEFSHSVCPDCYQRLIVPELEAMKRNAAKPTVERLKDGS